MSAPFPATTMPDHDWWATLWPNPEQVRPAAEMLKRAEAEVARQGTSICQWICGDAREISTLLPKPVDYVLMANTFHGVPDQIGLARAVRSVLRRQGLFGLINWLPLAREETTVLGQPRGPRTEMRR